MMKPSYETDLYRRIHDELAKIQMTDCHEHLQREGELPQGADIHLGRLFAHYASCDLITAGMPASIMGKVQTDASLDPAERWKLLKPWYQKAWNTGYCEALRIALRDLYRVEDLTDDTVEDLTEAMRQEIKPGFTRQVFNRAGIDYAMNNPFEIPHRTAGGERQYHHQ